MKVSQRRITSATQSGVIRSTATSAPTCVANRTKYVIARETGARTLSTIDMLDDIGVSGVSASRLLLALNSLDLFSLAGSRDVGLVGAARTSSSNVNYRLSGTTSSISRSSQTPTATNIGVFATSGGSNATNARISFYSIGESLDLALLDARVTQLMTDIGAAIP